MKFKEKLLLVLILLLGFFLRFYNINWDSSTHLHPDERAIVMQTIPLNIPKNLSTLLSPESPMNPHFFAYGNFPLYLLKISSLVGALLINSRLEGYNGIELVGRLISVLADIATIILVYKITKALFENTAAFAAAFLYAFSTFSIQASHYYAVDILLTFFIMLTLLRLIKFYEKPTLINASLVGISFGISLSTKISAIPLIVAVFTAISLDFFLIFIKTPHKVKSWFPHLPAFARSLFKDGVTIVFFAILTFIITQPYALIDSDEFISQNLIQSQMSSNAYIFPYTLQYVGIVPYYYELKNLFLWGLGPAIAIICFTGIIYFLLRFKQLSKQARSESLIIISFTLIYFLIIGKFAVGWMRYMLPLYPVLTMFGGIFLIRILNIYRDVKLKIVGSFLTIITLLVLIIWPLSYISVYQKPNTRVSATEWINKNIPAGSTLAVEHWDDQLPLYSQNNYKFNILTLYDQPDNTTKWVVINDKIKNSDYIIIDSNRLYIPLQKLTDCNKYRECFPLTATYYKNLFSGRLGYKKVAEFTSFPTVPFLNIRINDQGADESFTVIDHPKVMIFKKMRL